MNWLAHVALSPDDPAFRLGNLFADLVPRRDEAQFSAAFRQGCACHRAIDATTDSHPLVAQAKTLTGPGFQRYAGVILDIYFDHLLALNWFSFYRDRLSDFTADFYRAASPLTAPLPPPAQTAWQRIVQHDVLASMSDVGSVDFALQRISARWQARFGRVIEMRPALDRLEAAEPQVTELFMSFYPALQHSAQRQWSPAAA